MGSLKISANETESALVEPDGVNRVPKANSSEHTLEVAGDGPCHTDGHDCIRRLGLRAHSLP